MTKRLLATLFIWAVVALSNGSAFAQSWPEFPVDPENAHAFVRGPGGYLAWWKLLLLGITLLPWVALADWMNVDCQINFARTRINPFWWNPLVVGLFLLGFLAALFVPIFWVGWPFMMLAAYAPFAFYVTLRNNRMPSHMSILNKGHLSRKMKGPRNLVEGTAASEEGPAVQFAPGGDAKQAQVNLIRARQVANFQILKALFFDVVVSRADTVVAQRGSGGVQWRKRIDGVWHTLPAMDREIGDATVSGLKFLSNIDPTDRVAQPSGHFTIRTDAGPRRCETSISVQPNGENVQIRFIETKKPVLSLGELGMFPESVEKFKERLNAPGLIIVSAYPGAGLSTSWHSVLQATDRVTRDWVAIVDHDELETRTENIDVQRFDSRRNQNPIDVLRSILLKQPDAFVLPTISDAASLDAMTHQVLKEGRTVITRMPARSAAEALLRLLQIAVKRREFIQAVTDVTGQQIARRLCDQCKQPMPTTPEIIKQLGGDPANPPVIYKSYVKPDPPPVDKKGRPIELPPCKKYAAFGYYGRVGLIELIEVDEPIRLAMTQQPDVKTLSNLALNKRQQSALQQGYRHILAGTTSPAEIQRVFKESE